MTAADSPDPRGACNIPKSRPKKQHQAPQAYLSNFADARGQVRVYDRMTQKTRLDHVWNLAAENDLYNFADEDGNKSDAFELGVLQDMDKRSCPRLAEATRAAATADPSRTGVRPLLHRAPARSY